MNEWEQELSNRNTEEQIERAEEASQLWVISYSDFMTILMIFFLMMFAHRVWSKTVTWEREKMEKMIAAAQAQKGMIQRLNRMADVEVNADRIDIHLPDALLFDSGRAELRPAAEVLINQISPDLAGFDGNIVVEGHTDDIPLAPGSHFKNNWELSVARSFGVIRELQKNGVDPQRMSARGYGEFRPRAPNDTPENRSANRRIEIVLLKEGISPNPLPEGEGTGEGDSKNAP